MDERVEKMAAWLRGAYGYCPEKNMECARLLEELASKIEKLAEYEKPLAPMTWEEALLDDAFLEVRDGDYVDLALNEFAVDVGDCGYVNYTKHGGIGYMGTREEYGKEWRCWSRRPTDEERKAAKWDE